jgi:hypothetical protein
MILASSYLKERDCIDRGLLAALEYLLHYALSVGNTPKRQQVQTNLYKYGFACALKYMVQGIAQNQNLQRWMGQM